MKDYSVIEKNNMEYLQRNNIPYATVRLTYNILQHSIFDATVPIRSFLKSQGIHDFDTQKNGRDYKAFVDTHILTFMRDVTTETSLYRAGTRGDERMWFGYEILPLTKPDDIYAMLAYKNELYIINISTNELESCFESPYSNTIKYIISKLRR